MAALLTDEQAAEQFGLPSPRTLRTLRGQGLPAVFLGKRWLFDPADIQRFIEERKVTRCRARTEGNSLYACPGGTPGTSRSMTATADARSVRRARQIAE